MPSQTKQAIIDAFLQLAGQRTLEKITVRDVVDACGINRNTFYYHFHDIYAVIEGLCAQAVETLPQGGTIEELMTVFVKGAFSFSDRYEKASRQLALSLGRDGIERCFAATDLDKRIVEALRSSQGEANDLHYDHVATLFVRHAVIGLLVDVVHSKKKPDKERLICEIGRLCALFGAQQGEIQTKEELV